MSWVIKKSSYLRTNNFSNIFPYGWLFPRDAACDKYQEMDAVRSQYCNYFSCMQSLLWGRLFVFSFEIYDPGLEYKHLWPESG